MINHKIISEIESITHLKLRVEPIRPFDEKKDKVGRQALTARYEITAGVRKLPFEVQVWWEH